MNPESYDYWYEAEYEDECYRHQRTRNELARTRRERDSAKAQLDNQRRWNANAQAALNQIGSVLTAYNVTGDPTLIDAALALAENHPEA